MNRYKMIWSSMLGTLQWEFGYETASDGMALEYARLHTTNIMEHSDGSLIDTMMVCRWKDDDWNVIGVIGLKQRIVVGLMP